MLSTHVKYIYLLIPIIFLAGCVNYSGINSRGHVKSPQDIPSQAVFSDALAVEWPKDTWWEAFGDSQLNRLINGALKNNPDIQEVQARMDKATSFLDLAAADRYPQLDASGGVSRNRLSRSEDYDSVGNRYLTLRSLDLSFGYTFDLWGGKRAAWEAALGKARASEVDVQAARLNLASSVVKAYNQLGTSWEVSDLLDRNLSRLNKMLELSQQRIDLGLDNQSQLKIVEGLRNRAEARLIEAQNDIELAKLQIAVLVGSGLDLASVIHKPTPIRPYVAALPDNIPAELLGRRPDIVAARWRVEAELKHTDAIKASFYPNVNLIATGGIHALRSDSFTADVSKFWKIAPTVTLPIFDADRLRSELRAGNAELDIVVAQYNRILNTAFHDIGVSVTQLRSLNDQVSAQERARLSTLRAFEYAHSRYGSGEDSFLDYLNAERQLIEDEVELALLHSKQVDSSVSLVAALGGGFVE